MLPTTNYVRAMTFALTLSMAAGSVSGQQAPTEKTPSAVDAEVSRMALLATQNLDATKPVGGPAAAPVINREGMLSDTIAQLLPKLKKQQQLNSAASRAANAPAKELKLPGLLEAPDVSQSGAIVIPVDPKGVKPARMTGAQMFEQGQRWTQQDQLAAEAKARAAKANAASPVATGGAGEQGALGSMAGENQFRTAETTRLGEPNVALGSDGASSGGDESWKQLAEPGQYHQLLDIFSGTWSVEGRFDTGAGQAPEVATGTMTSAWQLGKRWLKQDYSGSMPSMGSFDGIGYLGFDNAQQRFVTTWMDTLSTSAITSVGTFDGATGTFTFVGSFTVPGGQVFKQKQVVAVQSADQYSTVMYLVSPDGTESRTGEVRYQRTGGVRTFTNGQKE